MDFPGKLRTHHHMLAQGFAALMLMTAQQAKANDDADLLQALTCQLSDDAARNAKSSAVLEAKARKSEDGSLCLERRVQRRRSSRLSSSMGSPVSRQGRMLPARRFPTSAPRRVRDRSEQDRMPIIQAPYRALICGEVGTTCR